MSAENSLAAPLSDTEPASASTRVMERPSSRHIRGLDGYRGIAFLLVFARHYGYSKHLNSHSIAFVKYFSFLGWIGVDLFFVLSGFLITGILLDTLPDPHYFRNFIMRRVLRIFPLYYGVLFLMLALTPVFHLQWRAGHIAYFLYAGNIVSQFDPSLTMVQPGLQLLHFWSLALEEQFYLLWPLAIWLAKSDRKVIRMALSLSVFALVLRIAMVVSFTHTWALFEWASTQLPTRMDGLLYGGILAALVRLYSLPQIVHWARWTLLCTGLLLIALFAATDPGYANVPVTLAGYPLLAIFFASTLALALDATSVAAHIGSWGPLRLLGRYSYGLYVYHLIFFPIVAPLLPWLQEKTGSIAAGGVLFIFAMFGGTLALSVASYELYERHFLRLKRHFQYQRTTLVSPATAIESA